MERRDEVDFQDGITRGRTLSVVDDVRRMNGVYVCFSQVTVSIWIGFPVRI